MKQNLLIVTIITLLLLMLLASCSKSSSPVLVYSNDFSADKLGAEWEAEGGDWFVSGQTLHSKIALNKDLVLNKALPENGIIEVDLISHTKTVDIKFRAWGDKRGDMHDGAYHFILGGWGNKISTIAPLGEHDKRRIARKAGLKPEKWYKVKIVRKDDKIEMFLDGQSYLTYKDSEPLDKKHFKYFSFANWKSDCEFDNLKIYSLD